jgi:hypothetical protein
LERLDRDYQKRNAFIRGDLEKIKNLKEISRSDIKFFSNKKYQNEWEEFKPERIKLRKNEPVDIAFKIT